MRDSQHIRSEAAETALHMSKDIRTMKSFFQNCLSFFAPTSEIPGVAISNTLEANFCAEALNEAIYKFGLPEIMSMDQGWQFVP